MKDRFSSGPENYLRFRPTYPDELTSFVSNLAGDHNCAWDCATGNGQLACALSKHFHKVFATDISAQQLSAAIPCNNVSYSVGRAEQSAFEDAFFDVITVGQAVHWFNFDAFNREVKRTLKPRGLIAIIGYKLIRSDEETNSMIDKLYHTILGDYWDPERKYVDEGYQTIPFPFEELPVPSFKMNYDWNLQQFRGYLRTWSAVKLFEQQTKQDPLSLISSELTACWKNPSVIKPVYFDVIFRLGKNSKF